MKTRNLLVKLSKLFPKWIAKQNHDFVGLMTGMPEFESVHVLNAIAIGIISGLGATGIDQTFKQMKK